MNPKEFKAFLSGILFDKEDISHNESEEILKRLKSVNETNGFVSWFSGVTEMTSPENFSLEMITKVNKKIEESNVLDNIAKSNLNQPSNTFPISPGARC